MLPSLNENITYYKGIISLSKRVQTSILQDYFQLTII